MKNKKIMPMVVSIVFILTFFLIYNAGAIIFKNRNLVIGTAPTMAPFTYLGGDHNNEIIGFDIDLAHEIAKDKGKTPKIQFMYFPQLVEGLQKGDIDMVASIFSISEERKKQVDFSEPYYLNQIVALVRKDQLSEFEGITKKAELGEQNKKMAAQTGTLTLIFVQEIASDKKLIVESKTWDDGVASLVKGVVDIMFINEISSSKYLELYDIAILPIDDMWKLEYAFAVKKGNTTLLKSINNTLERLKSSGEYDRLVHKHIESYLVPNS